MMISPAEKRGVCTAVHKRQLNSKQTKRVEKLPGKVGATMKPGAGANNGGLTRGLGPMPCCKAILSLGLNARWCQAWFKWPPGSCTLGLLFEKLTAKALGSPLGGVWTLTGGTKGWTVEESDPDFTRWVSTPGKGAGLGW